MKTFDPSIVLELAKENQRFFILFEIQLSTATFYYNNSDIDLYSGGNKYDSLDFNFDKIDQSADMGVDSITLRFNAADIAMNAIILSEDILGAVALVSFICVDANYTIIASEPLFRGLVSNWKIEDNQASIELKTELVLWRKETLRTCQSSCRWEFKGTECGYAGAIEWCDQSYEHCTSLANTDNFGGFRFLPDIMEEEIWWGRESK
jgi:hypothetical protein